MRPRRSSPGRAPTRSIGIESTRLGQRLGILGQSRPLGREEHLEGRDVPGVGRHGHPDQGAVPEARGSEVRPVVVDDHSGATRVRLAPEGLIEVDKPDLAALLPARW